MTTNRLLFMLELTRLVEDQTVDPIEAMVYQTLALRLTEAACRDDGADLPAAA